MNINAKVVEICEQYNATNVNRHQYLLTFVFQEQYSSGGCRRWGDPYNKLDLSTLLPAVQNCFLPGCLVHNWQYLLFPLVLEVASTELKLYNIVMKHFVELVSYDVPCLYFNLCSRDNAF